MSMSSADYSKLLTWSGASDCWALVSAAIKAHTPRILLWGPPGTGKTTSGINQGKLDGRYLSVNFSEDQTLSDLIGHLWPEGDKFVWHDGPVTIALRAGYPLIMNELGRASGPVLDAMLGVLDDPEIAELTLPTGETVKPGKGFMVIATSNSAPDQLDPALLDRFDVSIHIGAPGPQLIERLNSLIPGVGKIVENSYADPDRAISPRRILSMSRLLKAGVSPKQAAVMTLGQRAEDFTIAAASQGVKI